MRNTGKAQPIGEAEFYATKDMDEPGLAGPPPNLHALQARDDADDELPPWLEGNDLIALKAHTPAILIGGADGGEEGAILRSKRKLVISGSSKMGKTWTLCDLALAVASGGHWLSTFKCAQGRVLYVNLELDGSTAGRRMEWIASARGLTENDQLLPEVSKNLLTWNLRGKCYDIAIMLSTARARLAATGETFVLIILDPIYKTYGGRDENAAGDMASLMLELEQFADSCGASIAFASHFSKGNQAGKEAMDRISGSGVMARDPDAILTFTSHEDEDCYVLEASLREFAPIPATVFEWSCPVLNPRKDLDASKLRQAGKIGISKAPERAEAVRAVLEAHGGTLPSRSALTAAIKAGGSFPDNAEIRAWRECLKRHSSALADVGVFATPTANGKDPVWRLKTGDRRVSNDPF